MANETSTTEITELVNTELINPLIMEGAMNKAATLPYLYWRAVQGAAAVSFPRKSVSSVSGTTTTSNAQVTEISATAWQTTEVSITPSKYAFRVDLSQEALEDAIVGQQLFEMIVEDSANELAVSFDHTVCDLFQSFTSSVGSGGTDLTIANMVEGAAQIYQNGMAYTPGDLVYVLHPVQYKHLLVADVGSSSTTIAQYFSKGATSGDGKAPVGNFLGNDIVVTGNVDTLSGGAAVGAVFIRGDLGTTARKAAIGAVSAREVSFSSRFVNEFDEHRMVTTARLGAGIICDESGCDISTDET